MHAETAMHVKGRFGCSVDHGQIGGQDGAPQSTSQILPPFGRRTLEVLAIHWIGR